MRLSLGMMMLLAVLGIAGIERIGWAEEEIKTITLKDHRFSPAQLIIPANKKVRLLVENQDSTPEEFESYDLSREKMIAGSGKAALFIGPLKPGAYQYFGEFHKETAKGVIIASESTKGE